MRDIDCIKNAKRESRQIRLLNSIQVQRTAGFRPRFGHVM